MKKGGTYFESMAFRSPAIHTFSLKSPTKLSVLERRRREIVMCKILRKVQGTSVSSVLGNALLPWDGCDWGEPERAADCALG